jgi:hypothetical protein
LIHHEEDNLFTKKTHSENYETTDTAKWYNCGEKNRQKNRSKFWPGIANAMADQWGRL